MLGRSAKANLISGLLMLALAVELHILTHGFSTTLNNSLLAGAVDMLLIYAIIGRYLQRTLRRTFSK